MPLHGSMSAAQVPQCCWSAPPRRGSAERTMPEASCEVPAGESGVLPRTEQPRVAVPSISIPCQLVAGASRRSAAPGSQFVEWLARGRAQLQAHACRPGPSSPNSIPGRSSRKAGSYGWPGRAACLSWRFLPLRPVGRVAGKSPRPNQSLEPTRVGKPPLAAQLQRCAAGCRESK